MVDGWQPIGSIHVILQKVDDAGNSADDGNDKPVCRQAIIR